MTERGESREPSEGTEGRPVPHVWFLDARDARPVNPNTPEGEIRNMAAFAAGVHSTSPRRRAVIKVLVWLVLIGIGLGLLAGVATGLRTF